MLWAMTATRRGNLEGSIRQRSTGLWEARVAVGTSPDGTNRRRSFYGRTRKEVLEKLQDSLTAERRGIPSPSGSKTVAAFLSEWLQEVERSLAPKTFRRYRELIERHIVPEVGRIKLGKLTPHDVTMMMRRKQDMGLAPRTIHHMRAVLRRRGDSDEPGTSILESGPVRMDVERHVVTVRSEQVQLPLKEFDLLEVLLRNSGRVLTRMQLIDRVWGADYVGDTKTLDVHVKRLRAKIEPDPANPAHIVTVRGLGYKFEPAA